MFLHFSKFITIHQEERCHAEKTPKHAKCVSSGNFSGISLAIKFGVACCFKRKENKKARPLQPTSQAVCYVLNAHIDLLHSGENKFHRYFLKIFFSTASWFLFYIVKRKFILVSIWKKRRFIQVQWLIGWQLDRLHGKQ